MMSPFSSVRELKRDALKHIKAKRAFTCGRFVGSFSVSNRHKRIASKQRSFCKTFSFPDEVLYPSLNKRYIDFKTASKLGSSLLGLGTSSLIFSFLNFSLALYKRLFIVSILVNNALATSSFPKPQRVFRISVI